MYAALKRLLVGRPIATSEGEHQRLSKPVALATFSADAISSTAYATEEILFVIAVGTGTSLSLGLSKLVPISIVVAVLIAIVVASYRQTIFAYPHGGGSYLVSRDNLGRYPSLVAGASLLVDYILTVAVSISAGVAAIVSLPAFRDLAEHRVGVGLALIAAHHRGQPAGAEGVGLRLRLPHLHLHRQPVPAHRLRAGAGVPPGRRRPRCRRRHPRTSTGCWPAAASACSCCCGASRPVPWP